uniref:Uncharacterized protein n=1 Tax=Picea sitchensis TaxID=3332 RepID=A0A6B9XTV1_PICSI|nr:hypothetical protein Q903MT_gene3813 [Picea sitchensis]
MPWGLFISLRMGEAPTSIVKVPYFYRRDRQAIAASAINSIGGAPPYEMNRASIPSNHLELNRSGYYRLTRHSLQVAYQAEEYLRDGGRRVQVGPSGTGRRVLPPFHFGPGEQRTGVYFIDSDPTPFIYIYSSRGIGSTVALPPLRRLLYTPLPTFTLCTDRFWTEGYSQGKAAKPSRNKENFYKLMTDPEENRRGIQ